MSTHVVGIVPADEKYNLMREIWDLCVRADIDTPDEVYDFFRHEVPDGTGVQIDIKSLGAVEAWGDEGRSGFQVDITKLPDGVRFIRFYNSW